MTQVAVGTPEASRGKGSGALARQLLMNPAGIRTACQQYIADGMATQLRAVAAKTMSSDSFRLELDPDDVDQQTLLFWYPAATATPNDYIRSAVKIEAGAKSALDPHEAATATRTQ